MSSNDQYAVFGNPIAHSRSPDIHAEFAKQTEQNMAYSKQLVELGQFDRAARAFFDRGGKGLNVTVPFKEDAFGFADELTDRATSAEAVNTLALQSNGLILGDNTDGVGLVRDMCDRHGWQIEGKTILVLGAGGAVRGVLLPIMQKKPKEVIIANRTRSKAQVLAERFSQYGSISACGYDELAEQVDDGLSVEILINGTSASLDGHLPQIPESLISENMRIYDMVYRDGLTPFLAWCQSHGATEVADGYGMLLGQAAESFFLWRGVRPVF